jgi:hypothetical protein
MRIIIHLFVEILIDSHIYTRVQTSTLFCRYSAREELRMSEELRDIKLSSVLKRLAILFLHKNKK